MRRADRLLAGICRFISWLALIVAALTLWPLVARIGVALQGRPVHGGLVLAIIVPLLWAAIGLALRRLAQAAASGPRDRN